MNHRIPAVIGLCLILALAGCGGLTGETTPAQTVTKTDGTPQDDTSTENDAFSDITFPEGATADGFENTSAILANHQSALASDSYRIGINFTHAVAGSGGATNTIIASNKSQNRLYMQSWLPGQTRERFYTANQSGSNITTRNSSDITINSHSDTFAEIHHREARPGDLLTSVLTVSEFNAIRTEEVGGTQVIVYNVTNVSSADTIRVPDSVGSFNGTVKIDEQGLIWEASLLAGGSTNGSTEAILQEFETMNHGEVTVPEPAWFDSNTTTP